LRTHSHAAERATECGLDAIQLMGGNGYVFELWSLHSAANNHRESNIVRLCSAVVLGSPFSLIDTQDYVTYVVSSWMDTDRTSMLPV
jgi:hypothetical protein